MIFIEEDKLSIIPLPCRIDGIMYAAMKAAVFDLDGTLIDSLPGIANSLNAAMRELGEPEFSFENVRSFIGDGAYVFAQRACAAADIDEVNAVHDYFKVAYEDLWKSGTVLYEGVFEMLEKLKQKDVPLAVVSNKPHHFTSKICAALFPQGTFSCVMGQKDDVPKKPAPDSVWNTLKEMGVAIEDAVYIGDSTVDIETARVSGLTSLAVSWGYHDEPMLRDMSPEYLVGTVLELYDTLVQLCT